MTPADLKLVTRLQKSLPKAEASNRIFLILSISIAGAICLKLMGGIQARVRSVKKSKHFTVTLPGQSPLPS